MTLDLLAEAARAGEAGEPVALATVVRVSGSVPRRPPSKMLVRGDGTIVGSVGGGRIEFEVIQLAQAVARGEAPAQRLRKHLTHELAMCCGGEMELWLEPLDAARWKAVGEAARRRRKRQPSALVTALGEGGAVPGGKDVLADDECLRTRRPRLDGDRFVEPVLPPERVILFGAGHVAQAVAPLAARVGFEVVVCDEDEAYATAERFPDASRLLPTFDAAEVARELAPFGPDDYALIVTRDHAVDQQILERLLPRADLTYLGLIASRGKTGRFRRRLEAKGIADEARWAALRAPVGLDIGAHTPEEIAVAIVGELIATRAGRKAEGASALFSVGD